MAAHYSPRHRRQNWGDDRMSASATIHIEAPPEAVYDLITDVTRMGEWSPETYECEWVDGATGPAVGARFKGRNRMGPAKWSTTPKVTAAERGKVFEFNTGPTTWRYDFAGDGTGTTVTERYEITNGATRFFTKALGRTGKLQSGMEQTLQKLKAVAEKGEVKRPTA
jgi:uncharacterized protein YndB with AHSA1/START domain